MDPIPGTSKTSTAFPVGRSPILRVPAGSINFNFIGEAGVGKTALALGLAQRIASGVVPFELADMRILELDMMSVVAGTRFRGDFEERMNQIIDEIEADG